MNHPDYVTQLAPTVLALLSGVGASTLHSLLKKDGWSKDLNNGIVFVYALLLAVLDAWLKGQLNLSAGATTFLLVYGSATAWYNTHAFISSKDPGVKTVQDLPVITNP